MHHLTPRTRAIICVHVAGMPCDMDPIMALAAEHDLFVIEDCAQAHGARYRRRAVGSIGHVGAWSFCQDKIMTTGGEGGMVTTNDEALWRRMWSLKDHGKSYAAVYEREHPPGFRWLHESFGSTPDDGDAGGDRADSVGADGEEGAEGLCCVHGQYKCYVFVRPGRLAAGWSRDRIMGEINAAGVPCYSGSCSEVYLEKAFEGTGFRPAQRLPVAKELGETSLMFLVHPTLTVAEIDRTCDVLREVGRRAAA